MTIIKPTSDIFIHYLWGSLHNQDLLLNFINAVLKDSGFATINSVSIRNPFNPANHDIAKQSVLDIKAEDENGKIYRFRELQRSTETADGRRLYGF